MLYRSMCSSGYSQQARFGAKSGSAGGRERPAIQWTETASALTAWGRFFWQKSYSLDVGTLAFFPLDRSISKGTCLGFL
jgi:hypothetical protein